MKPILFTLGQFHVFSYGLFLALSFILSSFIIWKYGKEDLIEEELMDLYVYTSLFSLVVSRIVYIIFHFNQFGGNILKYVIVRDTPGLSVIGALIGGIIFLVYYTKRKKLDTLATADIFALAASFGLFWVSIGEFFGGSSVGAKTNLPWGIHVWGVMGKRHPVEIYSLLSYLALFIILAIVDQKRLHKNKVGLLSLLFLIGFSIILFLLEFFKVRSLYLYNYLSINQLAALSIFIITLIPISDKLLRRIKR